MQEKTLLSGMFGLICLSILSGVNCAQGPVTKNTGIFSLPSQTIQEVKREWEKLTPYLKANNLDQFDMTDEAQLKELLAGRLRKGQGNAMEDHWALLNSVLKNLNNEGDDFNKAMENFISFHKNMKVPSEAFQRKVRRTVEKLKEVNNLEDTEAREDNALDQFIRVFGEVVASNLD